MKISHFINGELEKVICKVGKTLYVQSVAANC
jgi:hypothetical protein